ncbi:DUF1697 domain-containing protein [Mycetocola spongiae]|uniref:DUF1697 domain-containing protein n=1 Tax=Mycetocola spongiae TaxID=2859226 RepID=UPI001CF5697C|nr:DUF1697 domain-containing protein [Mycetocola spongiae]UCR88545.1 DUF1697 domain-containing protein [Mycetocola spongiae]
MSTTTVALLRGINVGGVRVGAADLRAEFAALGATSVRTVLATGNVLYDSPGPDPEAIAAALSARFEYPARLLVRPRENLAAAEAAYPFSEDAEHHAYVVFLADPGALLDRFRAAHPDSTESVAAGEGVLLWRVPRGSSTQTALARELERANRGGLLSTTRNLLTLRRILRA